MKKIIAVAALATVIACTPAEKADEGAEEAPAVEEAAAMAADGGPPYGNFKVTTADGKVFMEDVREDGTWSATAEDGTVTTGTWTQKPGEYCTTEDKEGAVEECYPEKIDENGKWVSTDPKDGSTVTIERVVAEAAAE